MQQDLLTYYSNRAKEYETVYYKPERQVYLRKIEEIIAAYFAGEDVLEIACGTAYWTPFIAQKANSVLATDFSEEVMDIARPKNIDPGKVTFQNADIYNLTSFGNTFSAAFGGFIWSHIYLEKINEFLISLRSALKPKAKVFFTDNLYVEGSSTPIFSTDEFGNSYQKRKLLDGSDHLVLKNFPSEEFLKNTFAPFAENIEYKTLDYYWILTCDLK